MIRLNITNLKNDIHVVTGWWGLGIKKSKAIKYNSSTFLFLICLSSLSSGNWNIFNNRINSFLK